jgi:hypothetical protein
MIVIAIIVIVITVVIMPPKKKIKASVTEAAPLAPLRVVVDKSRQRRGHCDQQIMTPVNAVDTAITIMNIGNDNRIPLKLILSFILAPQKESMKRYLSKEIAQSCSSLPIVNKRFRSTVFDIMNGQITDNPNAVLFHRIMISPNTLAKIKSTAMQLDLSSIDRTFIHDVKETWGEYEFGIVTDAFGGTPKCFAESIGREYRFFLVVKCIETLVRNHYGNNIIADEGSSINNNNNKSDGTDATGALNLVNVWIEKCQASTNGERRVKDLFLP